MLYVASVLEPYLTEEGSVAWRPPMPCVVVADDEAGAIEALRKRFWVRVAEIEKKLMEHPGWKEGDYREVTLARVTEGFSGAESVFMIISDTRKPLRCYI